MEFLIFVLKAEEWLHAEAKQKGWSKWAKVQTRSATQGVVGVFSTDKIGVMLEVSAFYWNLCRKQMWCHIKNVALIFISINKSYLDFKNEID